MTTIPISQVLTVTPSVLATGGSNLVLNGLALTENTRVPMGAVLGLSSVQAVLAYFGAASAEYAAAPFYFNGFDTSTKKPATMYFAQCPYAAAVGAYIRGGAPNSVASMATIAAGILTIAIDGATLVCTGINLSGETTYSQIAATIQTALQTEAATVTAGFTASMSGTTLTVTGTVTGPALVPGMAVTYTTGAVALGTIITQLSGTTGGVGTYQLSGTHTEASGVCTAVIANPTCTFDSVSGAFVIASGSTGAFSSVAYPTTVTSIALQGALLQTGGAVLSQGSAQISGTALTAFLAGLWATSTQWVGLTYLFEPSLADKVTIAAWINSQGGSNFFAMWDSNQVPCGSSDTSSAGYLINQAAYSGTQCIAGDTAQFASTALLQTALQNVALFSLSVAASLNYPQTNGRQTWAFRTQAGLTPVVATQTIAVNLVTNGYNYYGVYGVPGNPNSNFFYPGSISGSWRWADSYINQILLSSSCVTTLLTYMLQVGNIPYTPAGYSGIWNCLAGGASGGLVGTQPQTGQVSGPIQQALNFGTIRAGVVLSASQVVAVNNYSQSNGGPNQIDAVLNQQGWFLLVSDPGATVREARGSPICILIFTDGQSVQAINLSSINVL